MVEPFIVPGEARSWVDAGANSHFPIQNLPFGVAVREDGVRSVFVRIGELGLDLRELFENGLITELPFAVEDSILGLDVTDIRMLRKLCYEILVSDNPRLRDDPALRRAALLPVHRLEMQLPVPVRSFVDFYSGIHHAENVGRMFRPDMAPLLPNYRHLPVGYNGRASSVVPTDTAIRRPMGQVKPPDSEIPIFAPTAELDFELELGVFIARGNALGAPIPIEQVDTHVLGFVLVNDWSARDVQRWEYQPLGPFLAKSFATSISPWIVTLDALEPFRRNGPPQDPEPLGHLRPAGMNHFDLELEVRLRPSGSGTEETISRTNAMELYWSYAQQIAHLTSNGTNAEAGDLYASGTISGSSPASYGSLLELSWRGTRPVAMPGGTRTFLEDGDTLTLSGFCQGNGYRVGFGDVSGTILPS